MKSSILKFSFFFLFLTSFLKGGEKSPLHEFNFSLWSEYKEISFAQLTPEEKTAQLTSLFEGISSFVQKHGIRRLIIKILDPSLFPFFHYDHFDEEKNDNFYYWALSFSPFCELEALFDKEGFRGSPSSFYDYLLNPKELFIRLSGREKKPFGEFLDLNEKLKWISQINERFDPSHEGGPLIHRIVLDPREIKEEDREIKEEEHKQNLVVALDQYRHGVLSSLINHFPTLGTGMLLPMEEKEFILSNLSRFPLSTDLKGEKPDELEIIPPKGFPSNAPSYLSPNYRKGKNGPLLDTVYLDLSDVRFVDSIYQNQKLLPDPSQDQKEDATALAYFLGKNFRGIPFQKGPGFVSIPKGSNRAEGKYTYFRTGGIKREGKLVKGETIKIILAPSSFATKTVSVPPSSNQELTLSSAISATEDIIEAEYLYTPIPVNYLFPRLSKELRSKIYFVFNTSFNLPKNCFFGNWSLNNFLYFLGKGQSKEGFLRELLFRNFYGQLVPPYRNLVLYDYSTLPNGKKLPVDWKLKDG
ncbi:MAG: hypothetical protein HYZ47_02270 [Simkania negevensis]|nr:hypothetical protein [Simkania negevensis]